MNDEAMTMIPFSEEVLLELAAKHPIVKVRAEEVTPKEFRIIFDKVDIPKSLNDWAADIHQNAVNHGWWETDRNFGEMIALMHSEFSEALEEWREHRPAYYPHPGDGQNAGKPEGWAIEIVDGIIRALDTLWANDVDIDKLIALKHEYNKSRPYKHGDKRA
jgi:hypothetical protein